MTDKQLQNIIYALNNPTPGEPAGWETIAAFAPFSALLAAFLIAVVAWRLLRQKRESDDRIEWWKRTQWALGAMTSENPKMSAYGKGLLQLLAESRMTNPEDKQVLDAIWTKSKTHMQEEAIEQLLNDIAARQLTAEQRSQVEGAIDDPPPPGDNEAKKEER